MRAERLPRNQVLLALVVLAPSLLGVAGAGGVTAPAAAAPADLQIFVYDAKAPLDLQVVATEKKAGITLQSITYASPKGGRVPAALIVPDGKGPFAGMLFMHGAPGDHRGMIPEAETLARRGVVALLIDAPFSRPGRVDGGSLSFDERDRTDQIQLIVDLRRGIDLLTSRSDVDPKRLGYLGISYGGAMGGLLAGVEKRLAVYVLVVGDGGLVSHFADGSVAGMEIPPGKMQGWREAMEPIEPLRFVGRAAPARLLFQNGRRDTMVPPAHAQAYQQAGSEPKTLLWYDTEHRLGQQAVHDRHEWLAEWLGIARPEP